MRQLSPTFAARLDAGATTLCTCWRITRRDGVAQGFTDHDRDLTVAGATHAALSGLESTSFEAPLGLAVGGADVSGALSAASLSESDLANGLFDGARVEIFRVDWSDPSQFVLLDAGVIGEMRRTEHAFVAELRSLAHELDQETGRLFQSSCDADLGDARCRFVFAQAPFVAETPLLAGSSAMELRVAADSVEEGWRSGGLVEVLTGANAGARTSVKEHRRSAGVDALGLWSALAAPPAAGDLVRLRAGCDKSFSTCREKFSNGANFRGFPHMPGNDHLMAYPAEGMAMDGGSLFR
ncbi:MAG: beta-tubulin [Hyphomicrobiales bacterium]|nr:beta-tubulin [Hyphomicrobiales bacterium]